MKNIRYLIAAIVILIIIAFTLPKSCNEQPLIDNSSQLHQIDSLKTANDSIKDLSDSLQVNYSEAKIVKDSLVVRYTSRYVTYYDTTTQRVYNCLPMVHVDSLVATYESLILDADTIIKVQSIQINNLEQQNDIKDTLLLHYKTNEKVLIKAVKKEKRNKFIFGIGGFISGVIVGKL
jgi:hypothetical protein